jgi:hypothetical protein
MAISARSEVTRRSEEHQEGGLEMHAYSACEDSGCEVVVRRPTRRSQQSRGAWRAPFLANSRERDALLITDPLLAGLWRFVGDQTIRRCLSSLRISALRDGGHECLTTN